MGHPPNQVKKILPTPRTVTTTMPTPTDRPQTFSCTHSAASARAARRASTEFLATPAARLARKIVLGIGLLMLFSEYLMPVVKTYNVKGQDDAGLKLVHRKKR